MVSFRAGHTFSSGLTLFLSGGGRGVEIIADSGDEEPVNLRQFSGTVGAGYDGGGQFRFIPALAVGTAHVAPKEGVNAPPWFEQRFKIGSSGSFLLLVEPSLELNITLTQRVVAGARLLFPIAVDFQNGIILNGAVVLFAGAAFEAL